MPFNDDTRGEQAMLTDYWQKLTRPHSSLSADYARQVHLLLAMVVPMLVTSLGLLGFVVFHQLTLSEDPSPIIILIPIGLLTISAIVYGLGKTRRWSYAGILLFIAMPAALLAGFNLLVPAESANSAFLYHMIFTTILASLLVSTRMTMLISLINLALVAFLIATIPTWGFGRVSNGFIFHVFVPILLVVSSAVRQGYLQQIRAQIVQLDQARQAEQQARQIAERASQAKTEFLSNMSHELRTPLNMVIGYTSSMLNMPEMYRNQTLPEIFRSDVRLIQDSGKYLLTLINDVLDLSKVEAGKLDLSFAPVDPKPIFEGVIATATGLIKEKSLQIRPDYPDQIPPVWGDAVRIRQILLNLMSNAVKFTDTGSVTLSVRILERGVRIAVADTGIGIPEEGLTRIFDRFQQIGTKTSVQGSGLGLDISQRLAELHGTKIRIESQVGLGSTFYFELPFATEEQRTLRQPAADLHGNVEIFDASLLSQRTVLIVEDDSATRQMLRRTFEAGQFVVVETNSGSEAIRIASALLPDLIVLDMVIKDQDGWEVLKALQSHDDTRRLKVIVLSAHPDLGGMSLYPDHKVLHKPVDTDYLLQTAQSLFQDDGQLSKEGAR
jgi:signal transduction histidine kinase